MRHLAPPPPAHCSVKSAAQPFANAVPGEAENVRLRSSDCMLGYRLADPRGLEGALEGRVH